MDLTQKPPRSPKLKLGAIVALPRFIDKARASIAGRLGDYKFGQGSAVDEKLIRFLRLDVEAFLTQIATGADDDALVAWIEQQDTTPGAIEIEEWSAEFAALLAKDDPDRQQYIAIVLEKSGLNPSTTTTFDWLESDDAHSFPAKTH